jgi:hypothetical protein
MEKHDFRNEPFRERLSPRALRILHRYLEDFVLVRNARLGAMSAAELRNLMRSAGALDEEIKTVLEEYESNRSP